MFNIGKIIGGDKIINTARKLGFGSPTGIDLPSESKGFLPDREWKLRRFKFDWSLGDTFNISIGQGALLSTPIQQMQMMAAIASRGKFYKPRLAEIAPMEMIDLNLDDKYLDVIFDGMYKVVNDEGGTAYKSRSSRFAIAGKTGTSQVQGKKNVNDDLSKASVRWERRNHALFSGFAPFDNPKYAVSVIVDHGGGGSSAAAPIAKKIFEYLL